LTVGLKVTAVVSVAVTFFVANVKRPRVTTLVDFKVDPVIFFFFVVAVPLAGFKVVLCKLVVLCELIVLCSPSPLTLSSVVRSDGTSSLVEFSSARMPLKRRTKKRQATKRHVD